jgi:hypothetical protein
MLIVRLVYRQSELATIATRIAEPLVSIPEEQLEHHTANNLYKVKSQSEQENSWLEAREPFDRPVVKVSLASWSCVYDFTHAKALPHSYQISRHA